MKIQDILNEASLDFDPFKDGTRGDGDANKHLEPLDKLAHSVLTFGNNFNGQLFDIATKHFHLEDGASIGAVNDDFGRAVEELNKAVKAFNRYLT